MEFADWDLDYKTVEILKAGKKYDATSSANFDAYGKVILDAISQYSHASVSVILADNPQEHALLRMMALSHPSERTFIRLQSCTTVRSKTALLRV